MIQEFEYKNKKYKIIENICFDGFNFIIGKDEKNHLDYMKITQLDFKTVFTPLDKLIAVLSDYNNEKVYNIKKILDPFIINLNKKIKRKKINIENVSQIIIDFNQYIKNNNLLIYTQISDKDLKNINKFISKYENKPLILKFCNVYGVMLLVSVIGLGFFSKSLINWYSEGKSSKELASSLDKTNMEEKSAFDKNEVIALLDDTNNQVIDDIDKYSYDYWAYSNVTMLNVDFSDLLKQNPDTVGWLNVNNTTINYPIVQSGDNSYYLNHSFEKAESAVGWIFADYRSNLKDLEKNTVIYGHGRLDNVMFGSLDDTLDSNWYTQPENQIIKISTPYQNMLWRIFSIYTIPAESYYLTHTFENDESYMKFLNTLTERSMNDFNVKLDTNDKILTLSTCLDNNGNRIVVHAKLIKVEDR